jgi:phosphoglucosamine mutase
VLFGTDGIRGKWGTGILREDSVIQIGKAIASWSFSLSEKPRILIITDTRESCSIMKACLKVGLLSFPVTVFDGGVAPTPCAFHAFSYGEFDCAVVISASHNPYYDNGIKILDKFNRKLSVHDEQLLSALITQSITTPQLYGNDVCTYNLREVYYHHAKKYFRPSFLSGLRVVLDCAHGAMSSYAPIIFELFGAEVMSVNNNPSGRNINASVGALYPEVLQRAVLAHSADIGFSFDGDGDRVIACSREGVIKDGDDILSLLAAYYKSSIIVGTVLSNYGLEDMLARQGKQLIRADVGDKQVLQNMQQTNAWIGGEPSGHIILKEFDYVGDGLLVALKIAQIMIETENYTLNTFEKYPQISINIPALVKKDLASSPFVEVLQHAREQIDRGRIVVRFSGTEPVLRIMIEAIDKQCAQLVGSLLAQKFKELLG